MARRRSALDSVLEEIQQGQGQEPTLQEMLKARAEEVGTVTESEAEAGTAEEPEPQEPVAEQLELETDSVTETVTEGSDGKAPEPVVELEPEHPDAPRTIEETYEEMKLTPKERDMVLDGRLRTVLRTPKQRGAVPTLVRYRQDGQLALRGVIIDIGEYELSEGWKLYKAHVPDATPERYLLKVYELTQTEIPRMYRTVGELRLE